MQFTSSIPSSVEAFDELNSISVARGYSCDACVDNEFGSLLDTGGPDASLLCRLSMSLGKYYTAPHQTESETFETVKDLLNRLQARRCKINIKYSAQQLFDAALDVRDHQAIMFALSGCEEFNDGECIKVWTNIVLAGVEKVIDKIKAVGKKKKARQEFVLEWNRM
jgi:hypothetical protein